MRKAIIIFVRKPELGKVKTRLAASAGDEKALEVYKALLQHTYDITMLVDADKYVFYAGEIEKNDLWNAQGYIKRLQSNDDLGGKMKDAFIHLFDDGYDEVVITGSDCFELTTAIINQAFDKLEDNDLVIGPANDGGYYLLGLKRMITSLFENKQWSTETVLADTINDVKALDIGYALLPELSDIDTLEDLNRYQQTLKA